MNKPTRKQAVRTAAALVTLATLAAGQGLQLGGTAAAKRQGLSPEPSGQSGPELVVLDTSAGAPWSAKAPADVSDAGRVVGQVIVNGVTSGYEWTAEGGLALLAGPYAGVGRINSVGDMVFPLNPLVLADGTEVYIENLFGNTTSVRLNDVNDSLLVVGDAPGTGTTSEILVWDPVQGSRSYFVPVARDGLDRVSQGTLAVGTATVNTTGSNGFVIDLATGDYTMFNQILPPSSTSFSTAVDVNEAGVVVGQASNGPTLSAFVWTEAEGFTFLPGLLGGDVRRVYPTAIDNAGRVVGEALTGANEWRAFVWDAEGGMRDLNALVEAPEGYVLREATDISETGVVIGYGTFDGATLPYVGYVLNSI